MRSTIKIIILLVLIFIVYVVGFTYLGRVIYWNMIDLDDYKKFPSEIVTGSSSEFRFSSSDSGITPFSSYTSNEYDMPGGFETFLEERETVAFIIIQNDTILYEKYYEGYDGHATVPSFSIVKSIISALIGIAIDEGYIQSVHQPVTDFLSGFKHEGYENITIDHLLSMRSGIDFSEEEMNPFSDIVKFYYGKNLRDYSYSLKVATEPGSEFEYMSINAQLAAFILEEATGKRATKYLEEKIWSQIGTGSDASWNLDCEENRTIKAFCCLNSTPYDFAKFGKLYLDQGKWGSKQIVPEEWVHESLTVKYSSKDLQGYPYAYFWRSLGGGSSFAKGVLGQYLYINDEKDVIMLRFGHSTGDVDWVKIFESIKDQL